MRRARLLLAGLLLVPAPTLAEDRSGGSAVTAPVERKSPAAIRADQLDRMFARLHGAADSETASLAEKNIWALWMASDSPTAEVLMQQAIRAMNDGAFAPALSILNRLIGANPDYAEAWNKRATLYFMMGRFTESLADIDKVLDLEPRHFGALAGRGMIYRKQENYGAALEAFRRALAINPNMQGVKDAIGEIDSLQQPI